MLDLHEVTFLGVAGLELVDALRFYVLHCGKTLVLVNSSRAVDRALAAGGLAAIVPCYPTHEAAADALFMPTGAALPQET
ncbi:STAS domain-containing protein [Salinifilum ghardaiensis]